jgi:1-acyl-sn-glycerol-3-phosphate acyltransferase
MEVLLLNLDLMWYWLVGRPFVDSCAKLLFDMDVHFKAPLPRGPKIIAPNHPSTTDPFLILTLAGEQTSILIEDVMFKVPIFGRYLGYAGHIKVVRERGCDAFDAALRRLRSGRSVVVFPEGDISPLDGGTHAPRSGAARLALETGAPIIPVGIELDRQRLRQIDTRVDGRVETGTWYFSGPYAMTVGQPLYFNGNAADRERVSAVGERIMQRITALMDESKRRIAVADSRTRAPAPRLLNTMLRLRSVALTWLYRIYRLTGFEMAR